MLPPATPFTDQPHAWFVEFETLASNRFVAPIRTVTVVGLILTAGGPGGVVVPVLSSDPDTIVDIAASFAIFCIAPPNRLESESL
jgi:hypothetical protein